jgi:hypothetical protein
MSFSCFESKIHGPDGKLKYCSGYRHNLTTDTATGYTNRRDWQSKALAQVLTNGAFGNVNATSTTATSLTRTGSSFPTAGQGMAGMMVATFPNSSGTGSLVFGVIVSNTSTVLTVDQWYDPTTGSVGTTPDGTCSFVVIPGQMPAMYLALTADAVAPSSADTTLASEITTSDFKRALATYSHTAAASTYTLVKLFNATTTQTINKGAVFASAVNGNGAMPFETAEPSPPTLISGDSFTQTVTVTI